MDHSLFIQGYSYCLRPITIEDASFMANSFVNKDIPANTKAFGTPVKIKGSVIPHE